MKLLTCIFALLCTTTFAQEFTISGAVGDSTDRTPLIGVSVLLIQNNDTTQRRGAATDVEGKFSFAQVKPGEYVLRLSYIGYSSRSLPVVVRDTSLALGSVLIGQSSTLLESIQVTGTSIQVEQKGDTLQYNANAFKTSRDATAEDLITKMPGMTSEDGALKAQGENVQKVLVDGKEFFGDDAAMALQNLPAEIIDKIEVFDRLSEQSQLTGFDDGQTRKTVNIVTKKGKNQGQFGRLYAGAGEDGRYSAGGNINSFKGDSRLSVVGLTNNVNQQNFSNEDLLGVTGSGSGRRGASNNFAMGQQSGISATHALGVNYTDNWGKKTEVSGSYFFNRSLNERITDLSRLYITSQDSGLVYDEMNRASATYINHRFTLRLEHEIDSANSIVVTPRFSFQQNDSRSSLNGVYTGAESDLGRLLINQNTSDNSGYNFSNNIVYRHRFVKRGRSFSLGVNTDVSNRAGTESLVSQDEDQKTGELNAIDQRSDNFTRSFTIRPSIAYTEPVGEHSQLQVNYNPTYRKSSTDKDTRNLDDEDGEYSDIDTLLSNRFDNIYVAHRAGLRYRYNNRKLRFDTGLELQHATLTSDQVFPYVFRVDRAFENVLPQFSLNYKFTKTENLRFRYRTSTDAPSVNQLQNVVDNRNPLFLRTGNPDLSQSFSHNFSVRYGKTDPEKSTSLLLMAAADFRLDEITNTSIIAPYDTIVNGIPLTRGTQLSFPTNIDGYRNARALITYGMPAKAIKSNINLNAGFDYNRVPALINGAHNLANNYSINQGVTVASNISENVDFTLSYSANYTIVKNSLQKQSDNNYFKQTGSVRLNWMFWKGFVFTSNVSHRLYRGLSAEFDPAIWYWNASLGYKFLKDESLEVKLNAFDMLNQNNSITRDITETYIEDRETNVLTRYFMVMVTYRLSRFNG